MIKTSTDCTRRRFLGSLIPATLAFRGLISDGLAAQIARPNRSNNFPGHFATADAVQTTPAEGAIQFESSDTRLVDGFHSARAQALAYVRNDGSIGPWYEAA